MDYTFVSKHFAQKTNDQIKEVLMDPTGDSPAIHYYMIRGGIDQRNITVWEPGNVNGEYIKTYGHFHIGDIEETYEILFGEGVVLLQKPKLDDNGNVIPATTLDFKAIKVKRGSSVEIPKGYGHVIVNTGKTFLVTADNTDVIFDENAKSKFTGHTDYESVKKMQGFAYYVIDNNGTPALKKNNKYTSVQKTNFGGIKVVD